MRRASPLWARLMRALSRLAIGAVLLAAAGCSRSAEDTSTASAQTRACRAHDVERELQAKTSVGVIVLLHDGADLRARQDRVLAELGREFQLERRYASTPGMSGRITRQGYERARQHADVYCVQFDGPGGGA